MIRRLMKQPMFVIGFIFICGLLAASILYSLIWHDHIPENLFLIRNGQMVKPAPLSPLEAPPLGTDIRGSSLAAMLLIGAKFTLGIAFIIALIRLFFASFFGWIYGMYLYRFRRAITGLLDGMHYIPVTILAFVILAPVLKPDIMTEIYMYSRTEREIAEIIIIAAIGMPVAALDIGNLIGEIKQRDFITSARVLGAGSLQIFWNEIRPHFIPKFSLICIQQLIQVMILLAHLGVLSLFFGGTILQGKGSSIYSVSNEWSGLIGLTFQQVTTYPWLFFVPVIMFTLTILAFSFMLEDVKKVMGERGVTVQKKVRDKKSAVPTDKETAFDFLNH